MSNGLVQTPHQHLILSGAGVTPTIPSIVTAQPGDSGWVWATDIMRGQIAWNVTDNVLYSRDLSDTIIILNACAWVAGVPFNISLIAGTPQTITFPIPMTGDYQITYDCFDTSGNPILPKIPEATRLTTGFTVSAARNCILRGRAILL